MDEIEDFFEKESKILLDTDDFTTHILEEFDHGGLSPRHKEVLKTELRKVAIDTEKLTNTLLLTHNKKYDAMTKYLQAEFDSTAELQNIVDLLTETTLGDLSE